MASKFARDRGYEEELFQYSVSENFKCAICLNVLNNPKSCRNNQHYFCSGCIMEHLQNSHKCPECMEELTQETLAIPPRVLLNCISELHVKCGYSKRGCPEYVQLRHLESHVNQCGYAPVMCRNEGCGMEINSQDKVHHETELCKFRKVECYGCGELKKEIEEMRRDQEKMNRNMEEKQKEMEQKMAEMMENQQRMIKEGVREVLKGSLEKVESITISNTQSAPCPTQQAQAMKQDVLRPPQLLAPPINHDVIIMGGKDNYNRINSSVEKFCCKTNRWVDLAPMIVPCESASSVVIDNQILVSGGYTKSDGRGNHGNLQSTDSIEILNLDQSPLRWIMSEVKLPYPVAGHQTFVYKGNLIVVCDYCREEKDKLGQTVMKTVGFKIFEVSLIFLNSSKELYNSVRHYPIITGSCKAQLVGEKIFLFGIKESVAIYDLVKNMWQQMPSLPLSRVNMSTILWRNQIILLGGRRCSTFSPCVSNVTMYDTETGESSKGLPSMIHKRDGCSAVITDEVIIVMGGHYNSVEFYDFRTNTWQALAVMKESRYNATAVVSPV